jgi:uncharacterized protein (TIGR02646 family)
MIRIRKSAEPKILADNAAGWLREFIETLNAGKDPTETQKSRYRHPDIKGALIAETHGKCAYCEAKALVTGFGDVEHIVPKKFRPALRFAWSNLTLACDVCNTKKGANENILDPYEDDPDEHLRFFGPMATVRAASELGLRTHTILELNRQPLLEHRKEKLDEFVRRAREVLTTRDEETRTVLLRALLNDARNSSTEFAACTRALILDMQSDGQLPDV